MFCTPYAYKKSSLPEGNSGKSKVEVAGYIPANKRIENMMLAGQRLVDARKEQYDFPDGEIDETFQDPTRSPNFDMADASQIYNLTEQSLKASQTAQFQRDKELQEAESRKQAEYEAWKKTQEELTP